MCARLSGSDAGVVRLHGRDDKDNIQALGENVLYYDGMTLYCVSRRAARAAGTSLSARARITAWATAKIVAWAGQQVYVLDKNGTCTFNDRMSAEVLFGAIGQSYIAVSAPGRVGYGFVAGGDEP